MNVDWDAVIVIVALIVMGVIFGCPSATAGLIALLVLLKGE